MPRFERSYYCITARLGAATTDTVIPLAVPALARASKRLELIQTASPEEFEAACRNSCNNADALFVAGGDGTVHIAVQVLSTMDAPRGLESFQRNVQLFCPDTGDSIAA